VNLCGEDHVGIGTDLGISPVELTPAFVKDNTEYIQSMIEDGIFEKDRDPNLLLFPPDLNTADRFEILAGMLSARGHSDARIAKILGGNFARVMRDVWGGRLRAGLSRASLSASGGSTRQQFENAAGDLLVLRGQAARAFQDPAFEFCLREIQHVDRRVELAAIGAHRPAAGRQPLEVHAGERGDLFEVMDAGRGAVRLFPLRDRAAVHADLRGQ
jgi:hypothetical protein